MNGIIKEKMFKEVSLFLSLVATIGFGIMFVTGPSTELKQDISMINQRLEVIETNHLPSLEIKIDSYGEKQDQDHEAINEIKVDIARIKAILEQSLRY
jgi:hypothetical protein